MFSARINSIAAAFPAWLAKRNYGDDPIASGDRRKAAETMWPASRWPTLYKSIPADIHRPIVWDGRILGGHDVTHFALGHLNDSVLVEAVRSSGIKARNVAFGFAALIAFFWLQTILVPGASITIVNYLLASPMSPFLKMAIVAGLLLIGSIVSLAARLIFQSSAAIFVGYGLVFLVSSAASEALFGGLFRTGDFTLTNFGSSAAGMYPDWAYEIGAWEVIAKFWLIKAIALVSSLFGLILTITATVLLAIPALWFFSFWATIQGWFKATVQPYTVPTRDALLIYKAKADGARDAEYRAYSRQVEDATTRLADSPLIRLGMATGTLRARGDMKAPVRGQSVGYDGESIRMHTLILGDTGTGKTREVLRPLFRQLMGAAWGEDHHIGAYVTDGKGTLWRDLAPIVAHRKDVRIIGTEPGHYGADLLAGMSPLEVSTTFKAVAGQVAGKPSEDFWMENASLLIMHAATIAALVAGDKDETVKAQWYGANAYSLAGIMRLTNGEDFLTETLKHYLNRYVETVDTDPEENTRIKAAASSIAWLQDSYLHIATETRSSILANVNVVLGKLSGAGVLTERFITGTFKDTIDVTHALNGGILMIAIGDTEFGLAGRVVSTWLKQRLYTLAKRKLVNDPEGCEKVSVALFADEYQMLVTTGPDSCTTFWNIARQTGLFMVAATQSVAALNQIIGEDQTANLMNLLRNKIVLSTGEVDTIDYIRKLVGELPQGWTPEEGFYATQTLRELAEPARNVRVRPVMDLALPVLETPRLRDAAAFDDRFLDTKTGDGVVQAQAAHWRQEDKNREALSDGLEWSSKLRHDELRIGQGHAFAMIYRAGVDRADIIDLRS